MLNKGDIVLANQEIYGVNDSSQNKRILYKPHWFKSIKGIVIGFSFIRTGKLREPDLYNLYEANYKPDYLYDIVDNKVWLIEPLSKGDRYLQPIRCLESDIELITKGGLC